MASPLIATLTEDNFSSQVEQSPVPVLVDFWAEWCGPCKMIAPVLDELATEYGSGAKIAKINIDDYPGLASRFRIQSIPTLLIFKNGQVVEQIVGLRSKRDLKSALDRAAA